MPGKIISINVSDKKGVRKTRVSEAELIENEGIKGDAHASGKWHRQVSLLAVESIGRMTAKGLDVGPGDFAENITTEGLDLVALPIGTRVSLGPEAEGEVTQIGKKCHSRCNIFELAGDCVMPREGIFIKVLKGGALKVGDSIAVL